MQPIKKVDGSILFCEPRHEELLNFYFDKFNFHKKDINPFIKSKSAMSKVVSMDQYSLKEKNLSRRVLTNKHSEKRIEKMY